MTNDEYKPQCISCSNKFYYENRDRIFNNPKLYNYENGEHRKKVMKKTKKKPSNIILNIRKIKKKLIKFF